MRFRTTILAAGKTATGIEIPEKIVVGLGSHKRPPVRVTIKGHTYRSTIAVMGGKFMVGVSAENRAGAGVAAGDKVDVDIELDTAPREVPMPADFAKALGRDAAAKRRFEALSFSKKQALAQPIDQAKTAETRQRRLDKALAALRGEA